MKRHTTPEAPKDTPQPPRPRQRRMTLVRFLLLSGLIASASGAFAATPETLDIAIKRIDTAQPPRLIDDVLLLSYRPDRPTRFVGARFAHESWKVLHTYVVNEKGIFVLEYPWPEGATEIHYRIQVDGLWMTDPANPVVDTDAAGNEFSVFTVDKAPAQRLESPRKESDGSFTFIFTGLPGHRVALEGDFNNWDPFMDTLQESSPGLYTVTLRVPPGRHWYVFYSDGIRILDRLNGNTGVDPDGRAVSYFSPSS